MKIESYTREKELTLILDIDGTICPVKTMEEQYGDLVPYPDIVKKIRAYHAAGAKIILFTSRNVRTYEGNLGKINAHTAPELLAWLAKWEIPYDEILYGKPWPGKLGFYVDDRSVRPDEFMQYTPEQLTEICNASRLDCQKEEGK